jgi:hypothetical protein
MIDRSQPPPPDLVELDVVVDASDAVATDAGGRPVLYRPAGRIRSPMIEHRPDPRPPRGDRPSVEMPPIRAFIGPLVWAAVPALPVLIRVGWQAAVVVGVMAIAVREARVRASRSTISFADGFLGYTAHNGWPHGVQEDDDVRWNWSTARPARPGQRAGG